MKVNLRQRKLSTGTSLYLDFYHNGKRIREKLDIFIDKDDSSDTKKEKQHLAQKIRAERELQLISNNYSDAPQRLRKMRFLAFYEQFLHNYQGKDKRIVKYSMVKFQEFFKDKEFLIKDLNADICKEYADKLKNNDISGLSGETPHNYFRKFKQVIKLLYTKKIIPENYTDGIKVKRTTGLKKSVLSTDELHLLALTPCGNEQVKCAFLFSCYTGLGVAEIRKLTGKNIQNGKLVTRRNKSKTEVITKLHPVAEKQLPEFIEFDLPIFQLPSYVSINKTLKKWIKAAGIQKHITYYCSRHTFAVQLLLNGVNLKTVADLMGHTSTKHTLKYLNYTNSLKDEGIDRLPSI